MTRMLIGTLFLICLKSASAQFTQAQKDTVISLLGYQLSSYNVSIDFKTEDYKKVSKEPLDGLTTQEVLAKKTNTFKDALLYKHLCIAAYNEGTMSEAEKYYNSAIQSYEQWMTQQPEDPQPYLEVLILYLSTKTYASIDQLLEEALRKFPTNVKILEQGVSIQFNVLKDYAKTQSLCARILAIDQFHLSACLSHVMASYYTFISAMNEDKKPAPIDISWVEKAYQAKSTAVEFQHLYHFSRVLREFLNTLATMDFYGDPTGSLVSAFKGVSSAQRTIFNDANKFFKSQLSKAPNRQNILNSLGFVNFSLLNFTESKKYYQLELNEFKKIEPLEGLILISFIEANWTEAQRLLELAFYDFKDPRAQGALLDVYEKLKAPSQKRIALVNKIENAPNKTEMEYQILTTWYVKNKNVDKATEYCSKLNRDSNSWLWRTMAIYVISDKKEEASYFLEKLIAKDPKDIDALKVKTQLKL